MRLQIFPALWSIFIRWGGEAGGQFSASLADYCRSVWLWHKHVGMVERATSGHLPSTYDIWWLGISGQTYNLQISFVKILLFCFVASNIGKGQVLGVWDVRNCVKITKSPFLSPFTQKLELARARKHTKVNLMSKWVFHVMLQELCSCSVFSLGVLNCKLSELRIYFLFEV